MNTPWKDWCWNSCILVLWCKQLTHRKSPWCWERLREEGKEDIRDWDGRMASLMWWTWTCANFRRWWVTERPGVLQSMESQRVGQDCVTEQLQQQAIPIGKNKILNKGNLEGKPVWWWEGAWCIWRTVTRPERMELKEGKGNEKQESQIPRVNTGSNGMCLVGHGRDTEGNLSFWERWGH